MTSNHSATKRLLAEGIRKNRKQLWDWYSQHAHQAPPPFYSSVDLRDSGHKIVPVDSNLYPAGFNNICPDDLRTAPAVIKAEIDAWASHGGVERAKKVLIVPEAHTQNKWYIENLWYLSQLLTQSGLEVRIGWYPSLVEGAQPASGLGEPIKLVSATSKELTAWPIQLRDGRLVANGIDPDFILLNNDFSSGYPTVLDGVTQPILPSHTLGWHSRKKTDHFRYYNRLAAEFAEITGIDPWLIQVDTEEVMPVNFNDEVGIEETAQAVDRILARTREAYKRHDIRQEPFAFIKNNSGTYGIGIMVVHSADELRQMNRRSKNKMSVGKNKLAIASMAVQEGIPTATLVDRLAAEPVIYLVGSELIGGFLRTNTEKGIEENLNSQGMVFRKLCMSDLRKPTSDMTEEEHAEEYGEEPLLELVYGSIARISALATGMELAAKAKARNGDFLDSQSSFDVTSTPA